MRHIRWRNVLVALASGLFAAAIPLYFLLFADLPDPRQSPVEVTAPSILITDRHGQLLYEVIDPNGDKHVPRPLSAIPPACQHATIATEDRHFYSHPGIDPLAIIRAAWQNWRQGHTVSGGSTLTQQLARNLYLSEGERHQRSLRRKLREAWLAWRLERTYSKDELLALYLNTTYYGHFAVGIEAAAQAYFGVHASELDLAQCALLAGLPQYPAGYNPIEHPQAARYRQGVVLDLMTRDGYITPAQANGASGEQMAYASTPFTIAAPHFVMWVQSQLEELLGAKRLRQGGLRVTTTLDLDWQQQAEEIVSRRLTQLQPCAAGADPSTCDPHADPARRVDNAALVALDPHTGAILAMIGSPDYFDPAISGAVNAALSLRQPGSAIKPLTYAAAFDPERAAGAGQAPWTPATLIADVRTAFPTQEGKPYVPQNYDLHFHGPVTARTALANSYNIPAVKALQYIGVDALVDQAEKLGISWNLAQGTANTEAQASRRQARFGLALTLGGSEVRLLDLTAAYGAFANGGQRVVPFAISRIETLAGNVLFETKNHGTEKQASNSAEERTSAPAPLPPCSPAQALDPRVAYLVTDILSDEDARVPAFGAGNMLEIGRPAAAKTGTTTDWRDNWTVGYTPDLVTGVWVGNADNTPMRDISGITGAGPIWHDFMTSVLRDTPPQEFTRPKGLVRVEICADSGLLPMRTERPVSGSTGVSSLPPSSLAPLPIPCPNRRFEWFIAGTEPTKVDTSHVQVALDVRTGGPASAVTPPEYVRRRTFWVLPYEYQTWAQENDFPQPPVVADELPARQVAFEAKRSTSNLQLASPDPNRTYRLDPGLPRDAQRLPITALPGSRLAASRIPVTLLLDGAPLATVHGPDYTAWWAITSGQHTFQAIATGSDGREIKSEPVTVFVVE